MRLIAKHNHGEEMVVLADEAGNAIRFFIARPERLNLDETYDGIIRKKDLTLQGYFAETNKGCMFIHSKEHHTEGERVLIKITKEARSGKDANGIFVTQKEPAKSLIQKLSEDYNLPVSYEWDDVYDESLENALSETVYFNEGAEIHINRTPVCWTIDVDSGNSITPTAELNQQAAQIIAQEIAKRHMGGLILIDFIGKKHKIMRIALQKYLTELIKKDSLSQILGWTYGGLFEIRRTRTYAPLIDVLLSTNGQSNALSTAYRICDMTHKYKYVPHIIAHPKVIEILRKKLKNRAVLQADITYAHHDFLIKEKK